MTAATSVGTHPPADLSMNETPYPPLPSVAQVVRDGAATLHRYPDRTASALVAALAARLDVRPEAILVGPGSAGLCQHLVQSFGPRPEVVHAALSFEGYPLIIGNVGARAVPVPMTGYGHDLPAMADAVTERTRCVLLCNPNNPTGAVLRSDEVAAFLDRIPADVPVIVDEAYREFVTDPRSPDGMDLYRAYDNVCVLRTFSKAYGLAALRIGYAVLPPRLVRAAALTGAVFFPNALAQAAAVASLTPAATGELAGRCERLAVSRAGLTDTLRGLGLTVAPSEANFVWLPLGERAVPFADRARAAGILVAAFPGAGVRITVGSDEATERLAAFVREALAAGL
ncbi:histidinol-phosphate transaminase [Micromonospora mirobrigensis]|uniref:Histidinol-phosphate aminotransferase n=1 Tax=Micromonospora mirobrigensis TaxID=262898 RepID=A0A1C4WX37_9ACTN|nr:histidinol-phosphate transaminase [Micromonospora mirobrigensis]SCF00748.1 histidinol-phosphate aminotransferase [Micromonospora mirobrigensis]